MGSFIAALLCGVMHCASHHALKVSPTLLAGRQVGIVIKNDGSRPAVLEKILIAADEDDMRAGASSCAMSFSLVPVALAPGVQKTVPVPGLGLEALARCLGPQWKDTFVVGDIAELSLRRRGCVSCDYRLDVWAWNAALPFELGYEARLGSLQTTTLIKAYAHFWKLRTYEKNGLQP
jgi:hypothetical protein